MHTFTTLFSVAALAAAMQFSQPNQAKAEDYHWYLEEWATRVNVPQRNAAPRLNRGSDFWMFRTRIRETAREPVNFGAHHIIGWWGCGAPCQMGVVIDARTGRINWLPIASGGYEFTLGSYALVVNPADSSMPMLDDTYYMFFDPDTFDFYDVPPPH